MFDLTNVDPCLMMTIFPLELFSVDEIHVVLLPGKSLISTYEAVARKKAVIHSAVNDPRSLIDGM